MSGCNCGSNKVTVHVITLPNGDTKRFTTEGKAREFQASNGGTYAQVVM